MRRYVDGAANAFICERLSLVAALLGQELLLGLFWLQKRRENLQLMLSLCHPSSNTAVRRQRLSRPLLRTIARYVVIKGYLLILPPTIEYLLILSMIAMRPHFRQRPRLPMMRRIITLVVNHLHIAPMQTLIQHHLVLLALYLNLALIITKLLKQLQLLLFGQVLRKEHFSLLSEELHLCHLVEFLHLVQLLELLEGMDLVGDCLLLQLMRHWWLEEGVAL